jgi:hypothetical protein
VVCANRFHRDGAGFFSERIDVAAAMYGMPWQAHGDRIHGYFGAGFTRQAGSSILRLFAARGPNVNDLSFSGFLVRVVLSLILVLLTFNPSGYSYVHMVADGFPSMTPVEAVLGILLLIGWIVFLGATLKSIGLVGMVLALALCAALVWLVASWGWVSLENTNALIWVGLVVLALIMAIGMAWAHLYRRWTGQTTVDEVNEGQ